MASVILCLHLSAVRLPRRYCQCLESGCS